MHGKCLFTKLTDIASLKLPTGIEEELSDIVYKNRMLWELCMEGFNSYKELVNSLNKRGFSGIPMAPIPMLSIPFINISNQKGQKIMIQRKSQTT